MRKILWIACILSLLAVPAHAEFSALERGSTAGRIIYSVSDSSYLTKDGKAITEEMISGLSASDYGKTGLVADGNSRLILRYTSSTPGTVTFSVSPSISGATLETLASRQGITSALTLASTSNGYQASAVLIAPEAWPENITYPSGNFTVTATFTPSSGSAVTESLTLTLMAPPVVLIHGAFGSNEKTFGYATGKNTGVWRTLEKAGLNVASWNYDGTKSPKSLIASNTNGLAQIIANTLNKLNANGFAATRVDLVTHSSGGLMARQYLRNDTDTGNKTANSYGLGTVRRVVTIASPNLGTPIASYLAGNFDSLPSSWQNWQAKSWWEGLGYTLIRGLALSRYDGVDEAMNDFSLSSSYIAGLGYPGIPFHSVYGKIKSEQDKISKLFDDVVTGNIASLSKIDWLPEQLVSQLTSSKLALISGVLKSASDDIRFKELLGALFGDDDYDLVVSETSAKDKFPANAVTSFTGLGTHNHVMIAQQNDVAERVLALLRGSTANFSINTASTAEYDAAFDTVASSFGDYLRASAEGDLSEYLDQSMTLEASAPTDEYMGGEESPTVQSVRLSGKSDSAFSDDIYILVDDGYGATKFFVMNPTNTKSFDVNLWADETNKGLYEVSYFTVQDGKLKISPAQTVAYAPKFGNGDTILPVVYCSAENIYAHKGDEVPAGLMASGGLTASAESVIYDISAPALGVASYTVSDPTVAEITSDGKIKALKEGTTKITATAYGQTASVNFFAKSSESEEDTTKDISSTNDGSSSGESSSGELTIQNSSSSGCNTGLGALILLSAFAVFTKKR